MSEYTDNCKRITKAIKDRPWLFQKRDPITLGDYVEHFEYHTKNKFASFAGMLPYHLKILDKYKDHVYNTMFLPAPAGNLSLHTIIQINKNLHIFALWGNSEDNRETILYATIYTTNPEDYRAFLLENDSHVYETTQHAGFAPGVGFR